MAAVWAWTLLPLALLHLAFWRRRPEVLRLQLAVDLLLVAVLGPALVRGAALDPVRCLQRNGPFGPWSWSESTAFQPSQPDVVLLVQPVMAEARRQLAAGRLPLLSERIGGGLPILGSGQTGLLAPVSLPVWVLGPERGITVMALWIIELAALGAFLLLRRGWRLHAAAAGAGAVAFAGGAYLTAWLLMPMGWVIAALPWAWWGMVAALRGPRRPWRTVLLAVALGWLMGSDLNPETAAIVAGSALLAGGLLHPRRWRRVLVVAALAAAVTTVLAWPTLVAIRGSAKAAASTADRTNLEAPALAVRVRALEQAVVPLAAGHPGRGDWRAPYPYPAAAVAVGGVGLGLLAAGGVRRRRRRHVLAVLGVLSVGAVLLYRVPPLDMLLVRLPPFDVITLPRFAVLVSWGMAAAVALAADGALAGLRRRRWWPAVTAAVLALVAGLAIGRGLAPSDVALVVLTPAAALAALALLGRPAWLAAAMAAELALYAVAINPTAAPSDFLPRPALVQHLTELAAHEGGRVTGVGGILPPNLASRYGLEDMRVYGPLRPRPLARMLAALGDPDPMLGGALTGAPPGLWGAWSVRWLVTPPDAGAAGWDPVWRDSSGAIWRNPRWLPEVRVVGRVVRATEDGGWRLLAADVVDLATTAVVPADGPRAAAARVELDELESRPTRLRALVRCDGPCLLVVARPYLEGWRATVDGRAAAPVRANLAALGVAAPAGEHRVELDYNPWRW